MKRFWRFLTGRKALPWLAHIPPMEAKYLAIHVASAGNLSELRP